MAITSEFGLVGAQRTDHHGDGRITQEFASVAPDINPKMAQALTIDAGFTPNGSGPTGMA